MTKKTVGLPDFGRSALLRAESYNEDQNTIDVVWTTGAAVRRYSWRDDVHYNEVLDVSDEAIRLDRLNAGAPFLNTHSSYDLSQVIGSVVPGTARVEDGVGYATIKLSREASDQDVVGKIKDGIIRNISVGYRIHKVVKTAGEEGDDEEWRVVDWEPIELSAVPIPADAGAQVRGEQDAGPTPCVIELAKPAFESTQAGSRKQLRTSATLQIRRIPFMEELLRKLATLQARADEKIASLKDNTDADEARAIEDEHKELLSEIEDVRAEIKALKDAERSASTQTGANDEAAVTRAAQEAVTAERVRVAEISEIGSKHDLANVAREHVRKGTTVRDFKDVVLVELEKRTIENGTSTGGTRAEVGVEDVEKRAAAIESAILHRANPADFKLENGGEDYRGMTLMEIARETVEARGVKTRGMNRHELAGVALERAGGYHGTSDFPQILANTINRTLRAAYEAAPQTFRPLVREVSVSDFKDVTRVQLGEAPQLDEVKPSGEFTRGTIGEGGEKYAIGTFGKVIAINRQTIINDDMNAFSRLPQLFGVQAAQLESDIVWAQLIGANKMSDGKVLFHADHKNLAGSGSVFSVSAISAARKAMSLQKGLDGKTVLNIRPSTVIVPVGLETLAEQVLRQTHYPNKAGDNVATDSMRSLQIISEPRLDNGIDRFGISGSETAYYFAASASSVDTIELAYLEGNRGVYTDTRIGFDVDGIETKVRLDVGAKAIEHRAFYKNAGA